MFPRSQAVDRVCFRVRARECFGLLGANGAGKTTTFCMLTGEKLPSTGEALVQNVDVTNQWRQAGVHVGYCPQFDALIEEMTGMETVVMFARLRGIAEAQVRLVAQAVLAAVGIEKHANQQVFTYSGGTKRRLSLGVALTGLPPLLLLDEPTSGVDPAARRAIWKVLAQVRTTGTAIVLTSHSMEECEALCSRLSIMAGGRLRCIGSPQHIKSTYGRGYTLQVKVDPQGGDQLVEKAKEVIATEFGGAVLKEEHSGQLHYDLTPDASNAAGSSYTWSALFGRLSTLVEPLRLVDYSLAQTGLEQVFLQFSRRK